MSDVIYTLAQLIFILWPIFILSALIYSLWGYAGIGALFHRNHRRAVLRRTQLNLLQVWLVLLAAWLLSLRAPGPTPSIFPEPYNLLAFFTGLYLLVSYEVYRLRLFPLRLRARIDLHETEQLEYLKNLHPGDFEELVAETYRALGYSAERTGKSGDHGVDVLVFTPKGERWVVQCKRYRERVGEALVRELFGTMTSERADRAVLVTSADITDPAREWARGKPISLVDGPQLLRMLEEARRKSQGSWFDRFARWFEDTFLPPERPRGLRKSHPSEAVLGDSNGAMRADGFAAAQPGEPVPAVDAESAAIPANFAMAVPAAQHSTADPNARTRPVRVRSAFRAATDPANTAAADSALAAFAVRLTCPQCGSPMLPHPRPGAENRFRCARYPSCRAVTEL